MSNPALVMRKKADGTMVLSSKALPDEHEFSSRMLGRIATEGWGRVIVELNLENAKGSYELAEVLRADPKNDASTIVGYKFRRMAAEEK